MKHTFGQRIFAFLLTLLLLGSVIPLDSISIEARRSYIGSDDFITDYVTDFNKINSMNDLIQWVYKPGVVNKFVVPVSTSDGGNAFVDGNKIAVTLKNNGDANYGASIFIHTQTLPLADYDLMIVKSKNIVTAGSGSLQGRMGGFCFNYAGATNFLAPDYGGGLDPLFADSDLNLYNLGDFRGKNGVMTNSIHHLNDNYAEGTTYRAEIYSAYMAKGGFVVTVNPNGGTYEGNTTNTLYFAQQSKIPQQELHNLPLSIPEKAGWTFAGWDVSDVRFYSEDVGGGNPRVRFNATGTNLLLDAHNNGNFQRLYATVTARWVSNGNSKLKIVSEGGNTTLNGRYLETQTIPESTMAKLNNVYTITFVGNPRNGDTVTVPVTSVKTTRTFTQWDYDTDNLESLRGCLSDDGKQYTFLGVNDEVSTITARYRNDEITLPKPTSSKKYVFAGWFTTQVPALTSVKDIEKYQQYFVGGENTKISFDRNTTLYAGWSVLTVTKTDLGWITNRTHLDKLSWDSIANNPSYIYRVYKYQSQNDTVDTVNNNNIRWEIAHDYYTPVSTYTKTAPYATAGLNQSFIAPNSSYYTVNAYGGKGGGPANGHSGGNGGYVQSKVYLRFHDSFIMNVGGNGSVAQGTSSTTAAGGFNGGGSASGYMLPSGFSYDWHRDNDREYSYYGSDGTSSRSTIRVTTKDWCGNDAHQTDSGEVDMLGCGRCGVFAYVQDFWKSDGNGTGACKDVISSGASYWMSPCKKDMYPAGSGGGATEVSLLQGGSTTFIIGAAGGKGASCNQDGTSPSGRWTTTNEWVSNKQGQNGQKDGVGGNGAGNGKNYAYSGGTVSLLSGDGSANHNPGVWITYEDDYTTGDNMKIGSDDIHAPYKPNESDGHFSGYQNGSTIYYQLDIPKVDDVGTKYFYRVQMYYGGEIGQTSTPIEVVAKSGLKGYYYRVDTSSSTQITGSASNQYAAKTSGSRDYLKNIPVTTSGTRWVHVAAVDVAGNIGPTAHYELKSSFFIRYNKNKGNGSTEVRGDEHIQAVVYGMPGQTLDPNVFSRDGYIYQGWSTTPTGAKQYNDKAPINSTWTSSGGVIDLYAVWKPIEYNIYYTKGKTDDITDTQVFGTSTRATNLQANSLLQHPYWHSVFDGTDTFAHIGQYGSNATKVKGTSYEIEFNANFPDSDKKGGAATQACKDSYTLNIVKSSVQREANEQTIDSTNKLAQKLSGYLISSDTWTINKAVGGADIYAKNGSITMSRTVKQNDSVYRGNYIIVNGSYCQADADWADINLSLPEPTMYGYHFLGWYTTPDYELKVDGKGNFEYVVSGEKIKDTEILGKKNTREESVNTQILTLKPDTTKHTIKLYAHWEPITAYLNYSYDDGNKENYTDYGNTIKETYNGITSTKYDGHLVNNTNKGYLAQNVHTADTYWGYIGRSEASAFFINNLSLYVPYARRNSSQEHAIEPALYFNINLYPRTNLYIDAAYKKNYKFDSVLGSGTSSDDYSVFMPEKFLDTVYNFKTPDGIRDELIDANTKSVTWGKTSADSVTYNRNTYGRQAEGIGAESGKYNYTIYDVWSLENWYYSYAYKDGDKIKDHLDTAPDFSKGGIVDSTKTENNSSIYRYDLVAKWKNEDGIKAPKPKRILVFDLDTEGAKFVNNVEDNNGEEPINVNGSDDVRTLDIYSDGEMAKLLDLAQGKSVSWDDPSDILPNVYQGKGNNGNSIITADDAKHSVVYDFNLEGWVNGTTGTTRITQPLSHISIDRDNKQGDTSYYAKWNLDNDLTLPQVEKEGYVFLGWYTVPQNIIPLVSAMSSDVYAPTNVGVYGPSMAEKEDKYYAGAGWNVIDGHLVSKDTKLQKNTCYFDWDTSTNRVKLYAWFNREPVFVDVYEGLFFEGQDVSLIDLKKLVGVFDFEDDYSEIALQYIESLPSVDKNSLYMPVIVDKDVNLDAHHDYSESEILDTLQIENMRFDSDRWIPVTSAYWQKLSDEGELEKVHEEAGKDLGDYYDELPNEDEENSSGKITAPEHKLSIVNGKLITPNGEFDGVYQSKEDGQIYYTDEAKAELAYWINDPNNPDYAKYTGIKLKVKSITYKVKNYAPAEEEVILNVPITDVVMHGNARAYDNEVSKYKMVKERDRYNDVGDPVMNGAIFKGRNGDEYTRKISKWRVDTSTSRMIFEKNEKGKWTASGTFDVTYEVTDDGILFNGVIIANSPITLTYSRECKIQYNKLPQIAISNLVDFTDTTYTNYQEFADMILDSQIIVDGEDNVTNNPWWSKKQTTPRLVNSLQIVKVKNICMDEVLLEKYGMTLSDSAVTNVQNVVKLKDLYDNYKTAPVGSTNWKVWNCISNFDVVVDGHDQWGKYASGLVVPNWHKKSEGGDGEPKTGNPDDGEGVVVDETPPDDKMPKQTEDYRTVTIILINPEDDLSMNAANIMETVRFISNLYVDGDYDSLGSTFWGTPEGKQRIREAIQRRESGGTGGQYNTSYVNELGQTVEVNVNDLSDD